VGIRFKATVYARGNSARIDIPEKVSEAFGDTGYVPVAGSLHGVGIRGTLMPTPGGRHVLNINAEMRARAGVDIGDSVFLTLDRGEATRIPPMSQELAAALHKEPAAKAVWQAATPAKRKDALARIARQRTVEGVAREVARVMDRLRKGKV
jgi:hypothetical protein